MSNPLLDILSEPDDLQFEEESLAEQFTKRSLYQAIVDRTRVIPNDMDGSSAMRAIPAPHDKTWAELQGLSEATSGQEFVDCMQYWMDNKFTGQQAYMNFQNALKGIGKLNVKPYSWRK